MGAISARAGAPNDGLKKGKDDSERVTAATSEIALWSKQNSDATGMRYQWGRKDPFTFATNSEKGTGWGGGKYPVKLYNSSGVLIHQEDNGDDNSSKQPSGGMLYSSTDASSMSTTVVNPITLYGYSSFVITQSGQSGDLYNYYWTSYSRGTDGRSISGTSYPNSHNLYLDSYIPLRRKSIYDPCPYGYRVPSNGTYNELTYSGWTLGRFTSGLIIGSSSASIFTWETTGMRSTVYLSHVGQELWKHTSISSNTSKFYSIYGTSSYKTIESPKSSAMAIRCIEDCDLLPDQTHSSAGY